MDPVTLLVGFFTNPSLTVIAAGMVTLATNAATFGNGITTLWQHLQRFKAAPEATVITRLLKNRKEYEELERLATEFDRETRPLVLGILRRQFTFYALFGIVVALVTSLAVAMLCYLLRYFVEPFSRHWYEGGVSGIVMVLGVAGPIVLQRIWPDPNRLFTDTAKAASKGLVQFTATATPDAVRLAVDAIAATKSNWRFARSRIATKEELRLVEEFVAADCLVRNLVARSMALNTVRLKLKLAPAVKNEIVRMIAEAICERRDQFKQADGVTRGSDAWRKHNKEALVAAFEEIGLRSEFTRHLAGGFLDNDFYAEAAEVERVAALFEQHVTLFRPQDGDR